MFGFLILFTFILAYRNHRTSKFLVISFTSDWRFPSKRSKEIVKLLLNSERDVSYCEIDADGGHDAFLMVNKDYFDVMKNFINQVCDGI